MTAAKHMISFSYQAKDKQGKTVKGVVEALNEKKAVHLLRKRGLLVITLTSIEKQLNLGRLLNRFKKVSFSDTVSFTRQLSTMVNAGLSLTDTLELLTTQFKNPALTKMIKEIADDIEGGSSLVKALKKHPRSFSATYISLVEAGEASGNLGQILERLAENLEKQKRTRGKIKGAMIYPTIIFIGMAAVVFIMMVVVVPKLTILYKDMNIDLPLSTQILISVASFCAKFWWLILISTAGTSFLFVSWKKTALGKKMFDSFTLAIPLFGELTKKLILVEFTRTLGVLVNAGVPILKGLNIVSASLENVAYQEGIKKAAKGVERGVPLGVLISENPIFPPILGQMITVGEETGKVDETLFKISSYFEQEGDEAIKGLTTALEPIIMIILGVGIGFVVLSIIVPIYQLTSSF